MQNWHQHGGPRLPYRKWNMECLDGEAMVNIRDACYVMTYTLRIQPKFVKVEQDYILQFFTRFITEALNKTFFF